MKPKKVPPTLKRRAGSLIELLMVVAIVAILASMQLVNGLWAMDKAHGARDAANKRTYETTSTAARITP